MTFKYESQTYKLIEYAVIVLQNLEVVQRIIAALKLTGQTLKPSTQLLAFFEKWAFHQSILPLQETVNQI